MLSAGAPACGPPCGAGRGGPSNSPLTCSCPAASAAPRPRAAGDATLLDCSSDGVLSHVLPWLSDETLLAAACASRDWRTLVDDTLFGAGLRAREARKASAHNMDAQAAPPAGGGERRATTIGAFLHAAAREHRPVQFQGIPANWRPPQAHRVGRSVWRAC
eukprot:Tamp_30070.p2 GENE.Tamp_30070~~Tamp_30070.p2  ORF type:complete len:182 (-),score=19.52 Tamp_30070:201-683(-)